MTTLTIRQKLDEVERIVNGQVLERGPHVACYLAALLIPGADVYIKGDIGVGKTFLTRNVVGCIGGLDGEAYFEVPMLGRQSSPDVLFGITYFPAMQQGRVTRNTERRLPRARVAHIGEVTNASDSTLDYLLPVLSERQFENDGVYHLHHLVTVICDSNDIPTKPSFWDRFVFRLVGEGLRAPGNVETMLRAAAERRVVTGSTSETVVEPVIDWADFQQAHTEIPHVKIPDDVWTTLVTLRSKLADQGVTVTERRMNYCIPVIQVAAWRAGRDTAEVEDMTLLEHVLWTTEADRPKVQVTVLGAVNPLEAKIIDLGDRGMGLATQVDELIAKPVSDARRRAGTQLYDRIEAAATELERLYAQVESAGRRSQHIAPVRRLLVDLAEAVESIVEPAP